MHALLVRLVRAIKKQDRAAIYLESRDPNPITRTAALAAADAVSGIWACETGNDGDQMGIPPQIHA